MTRLVFVVCILGTGILGGTSLGAGENYQENQTAVIWYGPGADIDGNFDEWEGLSGSTTTTLVYGGIHRPADGEGFFVLRADGRRLYVYARVQDDKPQENEFPPAIAWRGDSVEICLGITSGQKKYEKTDSHIRLVPRSKDDPSLFGISVNDRELPSGAKAAVAYDDQGYRIEASIPLNFLLLGSFKEGQAIRVDFQVNDADGRMERDRMIHWKSPSDDIYRDPSSWGDGLVVALPYREGGQE